MNWDVKALGKQIGQYSMVAIWQWISGHLMCLGLSVLLMLGYWFGLRHLPVHLFWTGISLLAAEALVLGMVWASQRAMSAVLLRLLQQFQPGQKLVNLLFDRLAGRDGERRDAVQQQLDRLPLAEAEQRLAGAVSALGQQMKAGSWLQRKVEQSLLQTLQVWTLARFRQENGTIELARVQGELAQSADAALLERVSGSRQLWFWIVMAGFPCLALLQGYGLTWLAGGAR